MQTELRNLEADLCLAVERIERGEAGLALEMLLFVKQRLRHLRNRLPPGNDVEHARLVEEMCHSTNLPD